ncbi:thioesterase family protein [Lophiostoma macrostomum CBS 122681]|uniref:Thioesterase family protein n=1 Tax=Lophiostoma macrostomum CBS 122681 TaxID=1314788 RepID=A0A6A6STF9_9PLEO|nr:thioesterase family protein [Lophiostoma macrostomum CBS 122681]
MSNILQEQIGLEQLDSHTYRVGHHNDWCIGPTFHGGIVAALVYSVAKKHFATTLAAQNQPDVHTLHLELMRPCTSTISTIKVTDIKVGMGASFLQLDLSQNGKLNLRALVTSTNFDTPGPTSDIKTPSTNALSLNGLGPTPDFGKIDAEEPDPNWLPSRSVSDLLPFVRRTRYLYPVQGFPMRGIVDYWITYDKPEILDGAHLAVLGDMTPSLSDMLLGNGGIFDGHAIHRMKAEAAAKNPGKVTNLHFSSEQALAGKVFNITLTMDLQFKQRVSGQGRWFFTRATTKALEGGRMDLDVDVRDEDLKPLLLARQAILVIDAKRRFPGKGEGKKSRL